MAFPLEGFKTCLSGRYEVLREFGAGGMATGYLARHDPGETDGRLHSCPSISEAP